MWNDQFFYVEMIFLIALGAMIVATGIVLFKRTRKGQMLKLSSALLVRLLAMPIFLLLVYLTKIATYPNVSFKEILSNSEIRVQYLLKFLFFGGILVVLMAVLGVLLLTGAIIYNNVVAKKRE